MLHCCKLFNAIEIAVLPAVEICKKVSKNKLYDALFTVKNQQERELFISLCCSFKSFLQDNVARKVFTDILLSWGYSALEIRLTLSEAVHSIALDENEPDTPFPFSKQEIDIVLKTWVRVKTGKNAFALPSADRLNQEQKYAAFGFAISLLSSSIHIRR